MRLVGSVTDERAVIKTCHSEERKRREIRRFLPPHKSRFTVCPVTSVFKS